MKTRICIPYDLLFNSKIEQYTAQVVEFYVVILLSSTPIIFLDKVNFKPLNYDDSLSFNIQLQNRIIEVIQLLQLGKFSSQRRFKGGYSF